MAVSTGSTRRTIIGMPPFETGTLSSLRLTLKSLGVRSMALEMHRPCSVVIGTAARHLLRGHVSLTNWPSAVKR